MKKSLRELNELVHSCPVRQAQLWRHYKGTIYEVKDVVIDCNTNEPVIVYWPYDQVEFVKFSRPLAEWLSETEDGQPRFSRVRKREMYLTDDEYQAISGETNERLG